MKHLDLFSGIGGFHLAAEWVWGDDLEVVAHCENDKAAQKVLLKHWPTVPIVEDIHNLKGDQFGTIDLITGGFPCQPFSVAGKRQSKQDDRYLWPEMLRVIKESKARWIIGENVAGIINLALDEVLASLEGEGYETQTFIIPACAVDAPHRRDRVWIVAYAERNEYRQTERRSTSKAGKISEFCEKKDSSARESCRTGSMRLSNHEYDISDAKSIGLQRERNSRDKKPKINGIEISTLRLCSNGTKWPIEPNVGRVANGIPARVDRLKQLGNAIVPQVAEQIMRAIKILEELSQ